jgi:hypothetical protein
MAGVADSLVSRLRGNDASETRVNIHSREVVHDTFRLINMKD